MSYKKFSADAIFDGYQMQDQSKVLILDERNVVEAIADRIDAGDDVQQLSGILTPGFINAHCHLELSHMKGMIPEHTGLIDFVLNVMGQRHLTEEQILSAIEKADDEMYQNGIVAVGDICNNPLTIPQKIKSKIHYHNFIEVAGFIPAAAQTRFDKATELLNDFNSAFSTQPASPGGRHSTLSPHAPYSVSQNYFL